MTDSAPWPLTTSLLVFGLSALVTLLGGVRLAQLGDRLADRLRVGEALFGAVLFGAATSLSGIVMTATAAAGGQASLAYSNAVGGIAAQTAALVAADLAYRHANLEHAAASLPNMVSGVMLAVLLTLVLLTGMAPAVTVWGIHPGSAVLAVAYLFGLKLLREVRGRPYWRAEETAETRLDVPGEDHGGRTTARMLGEFLLVAAGVSVAGWAITRATGGLMHHTGVSASVAGALLMGVVNALPESVTAVAAVRRGALTLAVAGILGGNAFDVLNLVGGDVAFRSGSLFHAARPEDRFLAQVAVLMTGIVLLGLLRRQTRGVAGIGFESLLLLLVYVGAAVALALGGAAGTG